MGPIEKLMIALEADDIDILAPDAEKQAFGNPKEDESNNETPKDTNSTNDSNSSQSKDSEDNDIDDEENNDGIEDDSDDSPMQDEGENGENEPVQEPENEDEERIKYNTKIRMKYLYDKVSSNLDKFISLDHDIKNFDIKKYTSIESKFIELKNNLFKSITDDEFISKDCGSYTKRYIVSKELYNVCIEMTDLFFQEYNKFKEREMKNNKQKYKDKK